MDLQALEDLIALVETGSVTAAAARRNITQPAFSRRLRAIETTLGIQVITRGSRPARPSSALLRNLDEIRSLAFALRRLKAEIVGTTNPARVISIAALHSIAVTHLPELLPKLNERLPFSRIHLRAANRDECFAWLMTGQVSIMLSYDTSRHGQQINPDLVERVILRGEAMVPVAAPDAIEPMLANAGRGGQVSMIGYPEDSVLGVILRNEILPLSTARFSLVAVSAFSSAVMALCERGLGIGWLPQSMVADRIDAGRLVLLQDLDRFPSARMQLTMMRARTSNTAFVDAVWQQIVQLTAV